MQRKREWFDDDSFWEVFYPFIFRDEQFTAALEQIDKAIALTKPPGKVALDLCCGPGRCSVALARAGFQVTGVDRTKFLLDKARSRARAVGAKVEWIHMDMRDFVRANSFDLVLSMYSSFGYFEDEDDDLEVLRNVFVSLKPGGVFLIDVMGKERLARVIQPTYSEVLPDGTKLIQRHEILDGWSRIRNEWILIRKDRAKSFEFCHTLYSGRELKERIERAGFSEVKLYGNFDGSEYSLPAQRLVAVARRAGSSALSP